MGTGILPYLAKSYRTALGAVESPARELGNVFHPFTHKPGITNSHNPPCWASKTLPCSNICSDDNARYWKSQLQGTLRGNDILRTKISRRVVTSFAVS